MHGGKLVSVDDPICDRVDRLKPVVGANHALNEFEEVSQGGYLARPSLSCHIAPISGRS